MYIIDALLSIILNSPKKVDAIWWKICIRTLLDVPISETSFGSHTKPTVANAFPHAPEPQEGKWLVKFRII